MPTIATVNGVRIVIYFQDHLPPHFHAIGGGQHLKVTILDLAVLGGSLPRSKRRIVLQWARTNQSFLAARWNDINGVVP